MCFGVFARLLAGSNCALFKLQIKRMTGCNVLLFLVLQKKQLARMQIAPFSWSSAQTALQDADCSFEFVVVLLSRCCDSPLGIF